ncbi:hypothetical protein ACIQF6_35430 [Kitasatospora sp. NPDC092948]|uniref:hypothetical protein n=1 Tax=Kitasatospora sp. NPDC092948 TaxID=3364088 RepID=UPI00382A2769
MYELSRVLLRSVGPAAARYENVLLDLSSAGAPVVAASPGLFGDDSPVLRPSPASVLHLENGGGKSVLIKLIFSVVLPGHRQAVGSSSGRALRSFVLENDVSHIVLEWVHAKSGRHLVTGKVSAWRNGRPSSDLKQLVEYWYHFRPNETLGLRSLPITDNGRYRSLHDYCDQLSAAAQADQSLEYSSIRVQQQWTERLADLGLDPELFRYQRAMNAEEGEAADAFSFAGDSAFVNSLLTAVLPPEPSEELAGVVNAYADKLAVRESLELEREFVRGALEHLSPLAEARRRCTAEADRRLTAQTHLDGHLRLIRVRADRERDRAEALRTESRNLADELKRQLQRHARLVGTATELNRLVAGMRLDEAKKEERQSRERLRIARLVEDAWQSTPVLLRHQEAVTEDLRLRRTIAETNEAARPALDAMNAAAESLRHSLARMHQQTGRRAATEDAAAGEQDESAALAQAAHNAAVATEATHLAEAKARRADIEAVHAELATAVRDGALPAGATAADAAAEAHTAARRAESRVTGLENASAELQQAHETAEQTCSVARDASTTADEAFRATEREFGAAVARTAALAADPDLAGPTGEDLDRRFPDLLAEVTAVRQEADTALAALQVEIAEDERARTALQTTTLLPPSVDAMRAVQHLRSGGITAWAGWEYLASLDGAERRLEVVRQAPRLASGIVVNDRFADACTALDRSELWPTEHLAMGTAAQLLAEPGTTVDELFVVPPHPALYDEKAADQERDRLADRHQEQLRRQAELHDRGERFAVLHTRMVDWRREFPPGRLEELDKALRQRADQAAEASLLLTACRHEVEQLLVRRNTVAAEIPGARKEQRRAERAADALDRLAEREARIPGWETEERIAREAAGQAREVAAEAGERSEQHRSAAAGHRRTADQHRGTAQRIAEELKTLPETDGRASAPDGAVADRPVEVLRRAYATADEEWRRVSVGEDLRHRADLAAHRCRVTEREVGDLSDEVRTRAVDLLAGPEGTDALSRSLAQADAARAVLVAEAAVGEATQSTAVRKADVASFGNPGEPVDLTPFPYPRHLTEAIAVAAEAECARDQAQQLCEELTHRSVSAKQKSKAATREAELFGDLSTLLGTGPGAAPADREPAFDGDVSTARRGYDTAKALRDEADDALALATRQERTLTERLVQHAVDERFATLRLPNRSIIVATDPADLPAHAGHWSGLLQQRLRSLQTDLDSIDRHRKAIVGQLRQQVEEAIRVIRRAETLSKLPEGLDQWSGRHFLQITFGSAHDEVLTDRLGTVIDEVAGEIVGERPTRREGIALVLRGVAAAVGASGFKVQILKPDAVLGDQRVPVSQIKDIFSGGQVLTAAIVLYCTMAALRSSETGRTRHRHSGVLFLDNPIGRASASYLLRLQQAVAAALGVQLIYTTGLFDLNVLESFPLVVRLRNSADLVVSRKYLTVEEVVRPLLDGAGPDESAEIDAVRYFRRPVEDGTDV